MVRLTVDIIAKGTSGHNKRLRDEATENFLKRLTHLYLEDKGIDEVGDDLSLCSNLTVLYLYDNSLPEIPLLLDNRNLTQLYLQNNSIDKIEHLEQLPRLTKLYLGANQITVLEGMESLLCLQELHVEHQHLPPGEKMLVDPRTVIGLNNSLQVLNISGNGLDSLRDLVPLRNLVHLIAADNLLESMKELAQCLSIWTSLSRLELAGNPMCHKPKFRDRIIVMSQSLEMLDSKEINTTSRQFLMNWKASKEAGKKKRESSPSKPGGHHANGTLPPLPGMDQTQTQAYGLPGLHNKQFQELLAKTSVEAQSHMGPSRSAYVNLQKDRQFMRSASLPRTVPSSANSTRQTRLNFVNLT